MLERRGHRVVRYADITTHVRSRRAAERAMDRDAYLALADTPPPVL
jgi:hypothetical protein